MIHLDGGVLFAQDTFTASQDSRLWLEGRSNVNRFECQANEYNGKAEVTNSSEIVNGTERFINNLNLRVEILTEGFDCGKKRMNRDLKNALKTDQFSKIIFELNYTETLSVPDEESNTYSFLVNGDLTVAGVTREIEFHADGNFMSDGRMHAAGYKEIKMTDFNVEPPTGLLGLVKADDNLTVHFNLISSQQLDTR
ncbi:MAG: YceI family protein [Balneolaceae bacterium]